MEIADLIDIEYYWWKVICEHVLTLEAASAALFIEEHDLDNSACRALWLVQKCLFTCVCMLNCTGLRARQHLRVHELLSINDNKKG